MRFAPVSFRPTFGRVLSVVVAALAVLAIGGLIAAGDWTGLLRHGWLYAFVAALAFALFWMPRLDVAEHEVTVRNVFSTAHIPWTAIQNIDTKYALTITTVAGRISVWASPAPNRYAATRATRADARLASDAALGSDVRPGDLPGTASGDAAFVIRQHWNQLVEDGLLDNAVVEEGSLRRDIHWTTIAVLTALLGATVLGFAL